MNIDQIEINNFKLFDHKVFSFDSKFNLIIGSNGTGKSSLLKSIAVALGGWAHAYMPSSGNIRPIANTEIREIQIDKRFDKSRSVSIKAIGHATIIDRYLEEKEGKIDWTRSRNLDDEFTATEGSIFYGNHPQRYKLSFVTLGEDTLKYIEHGKKFTLPLIAFYECDRIWLSENQIDQEQSAQIRYSRFDAYKDCFHTGTNHKDISNWVLKHELVSLQKQQPSSVLESMRQAAKAAIENCTGLRFDFDESRLFVEFENKEDIAFEHLSDGQRTLIGLFCDLARRAAILNPHLEGDAHKYTSGIVLIDELDLHLHPKWQRCIIQNLQSFFPKIQFICSTHSPFLIQSLNDGRLIDLNNESTKFSKNLSIEDIAEDIQNVELPQRSKRFWQMKEAASEYFEYLDSVDSASELDPVKKNQLKIKLDELSAPFSDDPAYIAFLEGKRISLLGE